MVSPEELVLVVSMAQKDVLDVPGLVALTVRQVLLVLLALRVSTVFLVVTVLPELLESMAKRAALA